MDTVTSYNEYRNSKIQDGLEYQDFVIQWMAKNKGLSLSVFSSKKYQQDVGESMQGIEIKFDMKFQKTGNLYIEIGEKAQPRNGEYYPSGIYRADNTWLYFIGNYDMLYVFAKNQLIKIYEGKMYYRFIEHNSTKTSQGFLLDKKRADNFCILKLNFNNG